MFKDLITTPRGAGAGTVALALMLSGGAALAADRTIVESATFTSVTGCSAAMVVGEAKRVNGGAVAGRARAGTKDCAGVYTWEAWSTATMTGSLASGTTTLGWMSSQYTCSVVKGGAAVDDYGSRETRPPRVLTKTTVLTRAGTASGTGAWIDCTLGYSDTVVTKF